MSPLEADTDPSATPSPGVHATDPALARTPEADGISPAAPTGRLVGRLVDPSAEEHDAAWATAGSSHPIRDRLLARAHAATSAAGGAGPASDRFGGGPAVSGPLLGAATSPRGGLDELAQGEPGAPRNPLDSELDRIALGGESASGPLDIDGPPSRRSNLSPNLIALFGTLLGLTTVGSLVALASHFEASDDTGPAAAAPAPAEAPASQASAAAAPADARPTRQKIPGPWRVADDGAKPGMRLITGKVGTKAFLTAIQDAGLDKPQAYRAYTALKDLTNLDRCRSSDEFAALVERGSGKLVAFEYSPSKEEVFQAATGDDGYLAGKKLDLHVARNQVRRALAYDGKSLDRSALNAGLDEGLDGVLAKALSGHMTLSELEAGDRLRLILQEVTVLGEFSRYAGVEALEVIRASEKPLRIYYYNHPAEGGYFDGSGRAPYEGGWRKPITGAPVTSKFNMRRMHPVLKKVIPHTGTDFGAPAGEPIGASAPGRVSFIGYAGPSGNLVKVEHAGGYETGYAHLSRFAEGLKVGSPVKRMQTVGYCGSTGRSTGPHLHFTVKKDGKFIDPESLSLDGMRVLPPSHREIFGEVKRKYDELLDAIPLPTAQASATAPATTGGAATDPSLEEPDAGDEGDEGDVPTAHASAPPAPAPADAKAAAQSAPAGKPAQPAGNAAIFLTDGELLRMQGATDDGEVD